MDTHLVYRGYRGSAAFDAMTRQHYGLILGILDRVRYEAKGLESLVANFETAVDEYIELLEEMGEAELERYRHEVRDISVVVQAHASPVLQIQQGKAFRSRCRRAKGQAVNGASAH